MGYGGLTKGAICYALALETFEFDTGNEEVHGGKIFNGALGT